MSMYCGRGSFRPPLLTLPEQSPIWCCRRGPARAAITQDHQGAAAAEHSRDYLGPGHYPDPRYYPEEDGATSEAEGEYINTA